MGHSSETMRKKGELRYIEHRCNIDNVLIYLLNYVYCLIAFPATLLFHQINRVAQYIILHSFKISTFLPITLTACLDASRNHRGCICVHDCHVQAAHHCCMLPCKEIGLAGMCPLLTPPHQHVIVL